MLYVIDTQKMLSYMLSYVIDTPTMLSYVICYRHFLRVTFSLDESRQSGLHVHIHVDTKNCILWVY